MHACLNSLMETHCYSMYIMHQLLACTYPPACMTWMEKSASDRNERTFRMSIFNKLKCHSTRPDTDRKSRLASESVARMWRCYSGGFDQVACTGTATKSLRVNWQLKLLLVGLTRTAERVHWHVHQSSPIHTCSCMLTQI